MNHTTTCTKCGVTIYPSEGKNSAKCTAIDCPNKILPQPEPDQSWATKIPEKFEGLGGIEREILSESLHKQYSDEPKIKGM